MSISNTSKPTTSVTNTSRVLNYVTWDTNTTTFDTETRTWDEMGTTMTNTDRAGLGTVINLLIGGTFQLQIGGTYNLKIGPTVGAGITNTAKP
jgi:hypothetical protein